METNSIAEGIPPEEGKFCADCKHLIGVRYRTDEANKWKCGHPNNIKTERLDLVTGIKSKEFLAEDIYILRDEYHPDSGCGSEGKWYEEYKEPGPYKPISVSKDSGKSLKKISAEDL